MAFGDSKGGNAITRNSVFNQTMDGFNPNSREAIPRKKYNMIMGGCLLWGFLVNAIICVCFGQQISELAYSNGGVMIGILIGYVVLCIVGIIINTRSDNPVISFVGYNMVVLPLGIVLSLIVTLYPVVTVAYAFVTTAVVTAAMMALSAVNPDFFLSIGRGLFVALLVAIIAELVCSFLLPGVLGVFDWIVAIIFCGYIGYDWARAQRIPATVDNAVDCACALYLDIVNLFIRLLEIFGRRD